MDTLTYDYIPDPAWLDDSDIYEEPETVADQALDYFRQAGAAWDDD